MTHVHTHVHTNMHMHIHTYRCVHNNFFFIYTCILGTCLAFPYQDRSTFVVGCETGSLLKCSLRSMPSVYLSFLYYSITAGATGTWTQSPVIFSFQSHHGPVYDIQCSPYHRNLFLSCGTNSACYLHSLLEVSNAECITALLPSTFYYSHNLCYHWLHHVVTCFQPVGHPADRVCLHWPVNMDEFLYMI